jgi:hypothetical protein
VSGSISNTLTIHLDSSEDLGQGTVTLFSIPAGEEGQFQSIQLVGGSSCQSFIGSTAIDASGQAVYQAAYSINTCTAAVAARPISAFFSMTMLKV